MSSEKEQILSSAVQAKAEILAKVTEQDHSFTLIPDLSEKNQLRCKIKSKPTSLPDEGQLIVQIFVGGEKYYSHPKYQIKLDSIYLDTTADLFHLQRREDFRLRFPQGYQAELEITSIKGAAFKARWPMMDISGGGCRAEIHPSGAIQTNDSLEGRLIMPGRDPFAVKGVAKHVAAYQDRPSVSWAGIQFTEYPGLSKNNLVAIVLDLYRELFSKLK